jgi:hypothetical protein
MESMSSETPPMLGWRLVKSPDSSAYDALVGEQIRMCGIYPDSGLTLAGPAYFRPFEIYERFVQRLFANLHITRQPRQYSHAMAVRDSAGPQTFIGQPPLDAPRPPRARGVLTLKFKDDLGNESSGPMSVYYPGTAVSKIEPKVTLPLPTLGDKQASIEIGSFTRSATVTPVRDDPIVTAHLLMGGSLAEYLNNYISWLWVVGNLRIRK